MLLVVCGMHRSGSTLVWQIARHLVSDQPGLRNPRGLSTSQFPAAAADCDDLLMAKVHFRPALERDDFPQVGAKYLYTYRDVRDVMASLYRKGRAKPEDPERGPRSSRLGARRELRGDTFWRSRDSVWIGKYEQFKDDVPQLVRDLADFLEVDVTSQRVDAIVADVDMQAQQSRAVDAKAHGVDDDLRVTSNHITDGRMGAWRDTLTPEELIAIEAESAGWLVEHGYELETAVGKRRAAQTQSADSEAEPAPDLREHTQPQGNDVKLGVLTLASSATAAGAMFTTQRNSGVSNLLWVAALLSTSALAYRLGQQRVGFAAAPATILSSLRSFGS